MIKSLTTAAVTALLLAGTTTAQAQMAGLHSLDAIAGNSGLVQKTGRRSRRNGRIAAGVALGVIGAIAAAEIYKSQRNRHERRWSRHRRSCNRWLRWCRNGDDRACWRYDSRC